MILQYLNKVNSDFYFLQETHNIHELKSQWEG